MASYLKRLIKEQAESYGEGVTENAAQGGFLLPDGYFLNMGMYGQRGDDHRMVAGVLPRKTRDRMPSRYDQMVHVAKKVGMYRWMPESWSLEAWTSPTRDQDGAIEQLADMAPLTIEAFYRGRQFYEQYDQFEGRQAVSDLNRFFRR